MPGIPIVTAVQHVLLISSYLSPRGQSRDNFNWPNAPGTATTCSWRTSEGDGQTRHPKYEKELRIPSAALLCPVPPSLPPSPAASERAAGYFSFGKSDTALPTALNFNSSRSDEGRTDGRSRPPSLHPYSTEGERPRALRLNRNLRNTHVVARLRLRRAPPFRDRGGKMGRRTLYLVRGREGAAIFCSR